MEGHSEDEHSDIKQPTVSDPECSHSAADDSSDLEIDSESHDSSGTVAQISSTCLSKCCKSDLSEPYHPSNILLSKKKGRVNKIVHSQGDGLLNING